MSTSGTDIQVYVRHPSEGLIKFLLTQTHPDAEDDRWIKYEVVSRGFPSPDDGYIAALRTQLMAVIPHDFRPDDRYHRASVKFMKAEGIYGLHNPDDAAKEANALVGTLRCRAVVEQLLLGRVSSKEIAHRVQNRFSYQISPDGVEAYKQYYWNVDRLRVEEWALLLKDAEGQRRRVLSILECGAGLALHISGFQEQVESKQILREMMSTVHWDFQQWKHEPLSPQKTKAITSLARAAVTLDTQLAGKDAQINKAFEAFEKLRLATEGQKVAGIKDLAPMGNYSNSGERTLEVVQDTEDEDDEDEEGEQDGN